MDRTFVSGGLTLRAYLAQPASGRNSTNSPAVVVVHGYPSSDASTSVVAALPSLADRMANAGLTAMVPSLRGVAGSDGQFGLGGWRDDIAAAVAHLRATCMPSGVWLVGFGTGGALSICVAAADPGIRGVAAMGTPADFDDWASQPRRLLEHSRSIGLISDPAFPPSFDLWARDLREIRAIGCMSSLAPRPVLLLHGTEDESVPHFDARVLADAHGSAELRIVGGAGHALRHDPRAAAILLGWLDRQASASIVG